MTLFLRDLRFALRTLLKSPAFTIAAALVLSLAIGANTAVVSLIHALLHFPVPIQEVDRVAFLLAENPEQNIRQGALSSDDFLDFREELRSFESLAAFAPRQYNAVGAGDPMRVRATQVTPGFFAMSGVTLERGRAFLEDEGRRGRDKVTILSYSFYQRTMGGDPDVVGRSLRLDGETYRIVGVAPPDFFFPNPGNDLWTPLVVEAGAGPRDLRTLVAAGRLAPGASAEGATAEARTIAERLAADFPDSHRGWTATVTTVPENLRQGSGFAAALLYSAITFVLLIASVNVANLILARALSREREMALRASLGASRSRLVAQLLIESVVLAFLGGGLGFFLGIFGMRLMKNALAPDPGIGFLAGAIQVDGWVVFHTIVVTTLAGLLCGLFPAMRSTRGHLASVLSEGGRAADGRRRRFLRSGLVMAEVALALALLVTAATLIRAYHQLYTADPGFNPENLLTLDLALPEHDYPEPRDLAAFYRDLVVGLGELPGSRASAVTSSLPLTRFPGPGTARAVVEGEAWDLSDSSPNVVDTVVSSGYFQTMQIDLRQGRVFDSRDRHDSKPVAIVTESFVHRFLEGGPSVDRRIRLQTPGEETPGAWRRIVGVVAEHDSHAHSLRRPTQLPQVFLPAEQAPRRTASLVVRTASDPLTLATSARQVVWALDPHLPISHLRSFEQVVETTDTQNRVLLQVLSGLALAALALAAVGIYSIIAFSVNRRTREIGIRAALGARPKSAVALVARQTVRLTSVGLIAGCALAWLLVRFMGSQLEGIAKTQAGGPFTFAAVVTFFFIVALLASVVPAGRAARLDPVKALRAE